MLFSKPLQLICFAALILLSQNSQAEQHTVGDYTIHYSVINSSFIQAETATQYGLKRSKNIALLNISVIKKSEKEQATAVIANVFGHASNLVGQLKGLSFREVKEDNAIYYLATFPINNAERLKFELKIQPNKVGKLIPLEFRSQVFID